MLSSIPSPASVTKAVEAYNRSFGKQDVELWVLSLEAIRLRHDPSSLGLLEDFVWAVKKWGRIQGTWGSDRTAMAHALLDLGLPQSADDHTLGDTEEEIAVELVKRLVSLSQSRGVRYRHYSWSSKILHWMFPDRIPVYDSFVRRYIHESGEGEAAYRTIVTWEYAAARSLTPFRERIVGQVQPATLFRAIDKFVWWTAGGQKTRTWRDASGGG